MTTLTFAPTDGTTLKKIHAVYHNDLDVFVFITVAI